MWDQIATFFGWLFNFFNSLPQETKDDIIRKATDAMSDQFRAFYRQSGQQDGA